METIHVQPVDIDTLALKVFLKSLDIAGGPRKLIEHRNLTWVPALIEAAYAVVLANEAHKTADDIAQFLGLTVPSVRNILHADPERVQHRIQQALSEEHREAESKTHIAGGLAKLAYQRIARGDHATSVLMLLCEQVAEILGITWPADVMRRVKDLEFPLSREVLAAQLADVHIDRWPASQLIARLPESIVNPSMLLSHLNEAVAAEKAGQTERAS